MMILTLGVTFNFRNGSSVVVVDMKAPYRLKTLIAICPNSTMIDPIDLSIRPVYVEHGFDLILSVADEVVID